MVGKRQFPTALRRLHKDRRGAKFVCQTRSFVLILLYSGALAQLGERLHGMQEVVGSNPIGSIMRGCSEVLI